MHTLFQIAVSIASVVVVLGVLVFIHEFGHFAAAKLFGVRVEVFSLGFGKRLVGFKRGVTDYRVSALPFGGYVRMTGENPLEARTGDPQEFLSRPRWQRFIVAIAGPFMNVVLAVGVFTGIFMQPHAVIPYLDDQAVVAGIDPGSSAAQAGLQQGDRIIRIDGVQNPTWEDVRNRLLLNGNHPVDLTLMRGHEVLMKRITATVQGEDSDDAGLEPPQKLVVAKLDPDMPAAAAGMQVGDEIQTVNGRPMHSVDKLIPYLQQNGAKPVEVVVQRNGASQTFHITPKLAKSETGEEIYRIGFATNPVARTEKLAFPQAFGKSIEFTKKNSVLVLDVLQKMAQRKVSVTQMSGPLYIAKASGQFAMQKGWAPLIEFMGYISLQLAIFNLLPIPILDGGMILMLFIEGIMRRDISLRVKERIYQLAFVMLILVAAVVMYNDLTKMVPGLRM